jgi:hypothetical protein
LTVKGFKTLPEGDGYDYDAEFLFGLDVVLDRLEQLLSEPDVLDVQTGLS